jgi:hypothetical protein
MHTNINQTKTKTDMNTQSENQSSNPTVVSGRARAGLKVGAVILGLTALCLAYRAAGEATSLYSLLDEVQATLATEQLVKVQVAGATQISETKATVAGL